MSTPERGIMSNLEARTVKGRAIYWTLVLVLAVISVIFIFPYVFAFTAGLKNSSEIYKPGLRLLPESARWENYQEAWRRFNMMGMFLNSVIICIGGVIAQLLISATAAYSLSRLKPRGGKILMTMLLITLAIPGIAYIIPLYMTLVDVPILHVSLLNKYWGLWLPYGASAFAIVVLKYFFDQIPQDIYDAAAVDGASPFQIFWRITLPLSRSILLVLAMTSFVGLWRDYLLPLLVMRKGEMQPITVRLFDLAERFPMNLQMAAAFIAMVPPLIIAGFLMRYMKGGMTMGAVKG